MAAATAGLFQWADPLRGLHARATDLLFFYPRSQAPEQSQYVVLVAIDDKSIVQLKQYGRMFGWPRTLYGDAIGKLAEARARTIVFDILFDVPTSDDAALADAI